VVRTTESGWAEAVPGGQGTQSPEWMWWKVPGGHTASSARA
jgi:hypothetical protein